MTVIEITQSPHSVALAKMQCDCGAVVDKPLGSIRFKTPKFCGPSCAIKPRRETHTGVRTGRGKWTEAERFARALSPPVFKRIDTSEERFWKHANKLGPDDCWLWSGGRSKSNYGMIMVRRPGAIKLWGAHRFSWTLANGEIPAGMSVLHKCDRSLCVNPAHLWLGTQRDNMQDRGRKGRGNQQRGSRHYKAKLSDQDILDIRASAESGKALAEKFNTTDQYISAIRTGRVRKDAGTPLSSFAESVPHVEIQETEMILALRAADEMARICDDMVQRGVIDARSALADARLDYGQPFSYKWSKASVHSQR